MKDDALSLLRELSEAHGAPGHEDDVRAIFQRTLRREGEFASDRLGCVMCQRMSRAGAPRVLITAHMDEVGFMVQQITERGFLQLVPLGGWWTHTLLAQRVRIKTRSGREVTGLITSTPVHHLSESDRHKVLAIEQLFVDVGASSRTEVEETLGIRLGDPVVPDTPFTPLANPDLVMGKAFDNRAGLAVVIQAFQLLAQGPRLPASLLAVGTVQEEIGCRGAVTAAAMARPDVAIILEGTPADDLPGVPPGLCQGALGKGPQIRVMDPSAVMSRRLVDFVTDVATEKGIPYQVAVRRSGGTDAKSFHTSGTGVPCVVIGVPARYIHSHNAIVDINDHLATLTLVVEIVRRLDAEAIAGLVDFLPK